MTTKLLAIVAALGALTVGSAPATALAAPSSPVEAPSTSVPVLKIKDYTFSYKVSCYCSARPTITAKVRDGKVVKAWQGTQAISPHKWPAKSIQDMLKEARYYKHHGGEVNVTWPKSNQAPKAISIDRLPLAVDDEVYYSIKSFKKQ